MKRRYLLIMAMAVMAAAIPAVARQTQGRVSIGNATTAKAGDRYVFSGDIVLDSLELEKNRQLFITPVFTDGKEIRLPMATLLVNGRNMHFAYERGSLDDPKDNGYDIFKEVMRRNGTKQSVRFEGSVPYDKWMRNNPPVLILVSDTCGCGASLGSGIIAELHTERPVINAFLSYKEPMNTEVPVKIHNGKARVQFEVDKTVLHDSIYRCRSGQVIDNRAELRVIYDSIQYALTDPNVEIAKIKITGYASPESPYEHNDFLATNRSKALAEFIAKKYQLPADRRDYDAVPENWGEFRDMVAESKELTEQQRKDLLELIDRPAYGPSDYDAKEKELKTSPKFAKLYKDVILPKWFPQLRATKFAITTRLKPMKDEDLDEVYLTHPEDMSLNQMFKVAKRQKEGSQEFNAVMQKILERKPDDPVANLNTAVALMKAGDYTGAAALLPKAGDSPEAWNARGALEAHNGNYDLAEEYFRKAADDLKEARDNLQLLVE